MRVHTQREWMGLPKPSSPQVDHKYSAERQTVISQCHESKVAWLTFSLKNPAPRQSATYFSSLFFNGSLFLFSFFLLHSSPNALAICWRLPRGQQTSVCRQTPSASLLSPLSLPSLSHYRATDRPLWEPSTALTTGAGLKHPQAPHPHLHSRPRHLPLTSTSHCRSLCSRPTPQNPIVLLSGWSWVRGTVLPRLFCHLLRSYSQRGEWSVYFIPYWIRKNNILSS